MRNRKLERIQKELINTIEKKRSRKVYQIKNRIDEIMNLIAVHNTVIRDLTSELNILQTNMSDKKFCIKWTF